MLTPDPLKSKIEYAVPVYGMKIDRKFFEKFETRSRPSEVRARYERGDIKGAEEIVARDLFNKPEDFFNLDKLRKAVQLDTPRHAQELLAKVFGEIDRSRRRTNYSKTNSPSSFPSTARCRHMPVIRHSSKLTSRRRRPCHRGLSRVLAGWPTIPRFTYGRSRPRQLARRDTGIRERLRPLNHFMS